MAKLIYTKDDNKSKEDNLKLANVYLKLGEVSLEDENYKESIAMNTECLKIQVKFAKYCCTNIKNLYFSTKVHIPPNVQTE